MSEPEKKIYKKICENPNCNKKFETTNKQKNYCCNKCYKKAYDAKMALKFKKYPSFINNSKRFNNPKEALLMWARRNSRARGIHFNLSVEDLEWPTHCPITGNKLDFYSKDHNKMPSLDRFDSDGDYVKGNCYVLSVRGNVIKNSCTPEEAERLCQWMKKIQKEKNSTTST